MPWIVIVLASFAVIVVVMLFLAGRSHPETAATHVDGADIDAPRNQTGGVARRPAGPSAENMSADPHGGVPEPTPDPDRD